jgi:hypothetical protein
VRSFYSCTPYKERINYFSYFKRVSFPCSGVSRNGGGGDTWQTRRVLAAIHWPLFHVRGVSVLIIEFNVWRDKHGFDPHTLLTKQENKLCMILLVHVLCHLACIKGKDRDLLEGLGLGGWIILKWIQPAIQWVPGAPSLGVKRPGREADHHLVARSKNVWSCTSTPNTPSWRGA